MADESFYTDSDVLSAGEFVEGQTSLGVVLTVPDGVFKAIRWPYPAVAPTGAVLARLYADGGGAALASKSAFDTTTLDSFNLATFTSELAVPAGTYRPTIVTPNRYPALGGFFGSGTITRGNLTMGTSRFGSGDVFPTGTSTATYFVDVVFEATTAPTVIDLGRITENTAMRALAAIKTVALTRVAETTTMRPLTLVRTVALGRITETTIMRGLSVTQPGVEAVGRKPPIVSQTSAHLFVSQTREVHL